MKLLIKNMVCPRCIIAVKDILEAEGVKVKSVALGDAETEGELTDGQRIAIARALLRNRPIMIFDESTSALDTDTERDLLRNILSDNDKTIIFVTHRQAVVEYCHQTLRVDRNVN